MAGSAASAVLLGAGLGGCGDEDEPLLPPATYGARVVDLHDAKSVDAKGVLDPARVRTMLRSGLRELASEQDLGRIWRALIPEFNAATRIGLKVNAAFMRAANSPALVKALVETLTADLGAKAEKIIVWDIADVLVRGAGVTESATGATISGTTSSPDMPGYETRSIPVAGKNIRLARLFTELTDVTLNLSILKDHNISGLTGALKNIYGCFNNPGDFHKDLSTALPQIYALPDVKRRVRLCITEAFIAVSNGGPLAPPSHRPGRLMLATDPVALDAHALTLLDSIRTTPTVTAKLGWLDNAAALGVGARKPQVVKKVL